jgi:predicted dehydrogenase
VTDGDAYARQLEAFATAIVEDRPVSPDARDGLAALTLIHAIEEAVESRGTVTL